MQKGLYASCMFTITCLVMLESPQGCLVRVQQGAVTVEHEGVQWIPLVHGGHAHISHAGVHVRHVKDSNLYLGWRCLHLDGLSNSTQSEHSSEGQGSTLGRLPTVQI